VFLTLGVWGARSVVLAGYWLYPVSATGVNVEWRLDRNKIVASRRFLLMAGRMSRSTPARFIEQCRSEFDACLVASPVAGTTDQLPSPALSYFEGSRWLKDLAYEISMRPVVQHSVAVSVVCTFAMVFVGLGVNRRIREARWMVFLLFPLWGLGFGYLSSLSLRFTLPYVMMPVPWSLAGLSSQLPGRVARSRMLASALAVGGAAAVCAPAVRDAIGPSLDWSGALQIPEVTLEEKVTDSGLRVMVPVSDQRAYNAPLPTTPYFNHRLRLRVPEAGLQGGFVEGAARDGSSNEE
jgi:hypothetical protein